jgi:hypothetical protein
VASLVTVSPDEPLSSWFTGFVGNGNVTSDRKVDGLTNCDDKPFLGFRIAAIRLPVPCAKSVLENPFPCSAWNFSGEVVRELCFVFCSDFFTDYTPVIFGILMVSAREAMPPTI